MADNQLLGLGAVPQIPRQPVNQRNDVLDFIVEALSGAPEAVYRSPPSRTGVEMVKTALQAPDSARREEFFERALTGHQ